MSRAAYLSKEIRINNILEEAAREGFGGAKLLLELSNLFRLEEISIEDIFNFQRSEPLLGFLPLFWGLQTNNGEGDGREKSTMLQGDRSIRDR